MSFEITWIGQGGFILALGDKILCIDPYLSNSVLKLDGFQRIPPIPVEPQNLRVDILMCTHEHQDHLDDETILHTDKQHILYSGPDSCLRKFKAIGIPESRLVGLNRGQTVQLGEARIYAVYAHHTDDSIGAIIQYDGISIYILGDTEYNERLCDASAYKPDILCCCINGLLGNMGYNDAARLSRELGVKAAIPYHYGMFAENSADPEDFRRALDGSGIHYKCLDFNRPYAVDKILSSSL